MNKYEMTCAWEFEGDLHSIRVEDNGVAYRFCYGNELGITCPYQDWDTVYKLEKGALPNCRYGDSDFDLWKIMEGEQEL